MARMSNAQAKKWKELEDKIYEERFYSLKDYIRYLYDYVTGIMPPEDGIITDIYEDYENFCKGKELVTLPKLQFFRILRHFGTVRKTVYSKRLGKNRNGYYVKPAGLKELGRILSDNQSTHARAMIKVGGESYYLNIVVTPLVSELSKAINQTRNVFKN
jgi:hypothetical protein